VIIVDGKRIIRNIKIYILLSLLAAILFFIYASNSGYDNAEWPPVLVTFFIPFFIIFMNFLGFVISLILFTKKLVIIGYILFVINFWLSAFYIDKMYNLLKDNDFLRKIVSNDMSSLYHGANFITTNIISVIIAVSIYFIRKGILRVYSGANAE
jgi:hypothetical protein